MSSTIPGTDTTAGETWTCTVTPNDGTDDGASASASVEVEDGICFDEWDDVNSAIDSVYNVAFIGNEGEDTGYSVASAGDVDGDGLDDVIVGSIWADKAWLFLGKNLPSAMTINLSEADYVFWGENSGDRAGELVGSAGDVDGDGLDDILISAFKYSASSDENGKVYLFMGSSLGLDTDINLADADYSFVGVGFDRAGSAMTAGDFDGDSLNDILIGAYDNDDNNWDSGKVYLVLASSLGGTQSIDLSSADYTFLGEDVGAMIGLGLASVPDIDGDERPEILIGGAGNAGDDPSKVYLFMSARLGGSTDFNVSTADYEFVQESSNDFLGREIASAGDVDGDGLGDFLMSAYNDTVGKTYLMYGASLGATKTINLNNADVIFTGESDDDRFGRSVSGNADVDGDGLSDVLFTGDAAGSSAAGKSYLFLAASLAGAHSMSAAEADFMIEGEAAGDYFGISGAFAGDVNGDGLDDQIFGAQFNNEGGESAGKTYLVVTPNDCP
jgi:hypothetical protein